MPPGPRAASRACGGAGGRGSGAAGSRGRSRSRTRTGFPARPVRSATGKTSSPAMLMSRTAARSGPRGELGPGRDRGGRPDDGEAGAQQRALEVHGDERLVLDHEHARPVSRPIPCGAALGPAGADTRLRRTARRAQGMVATAWRPVRRQVQHDRATEVVPISRSISSVPKPFRPGPFGSASPASVQRSSEPLPAGPVLDRPLDREPADRHRERAVLDRVGRQLVQHHAERHRRLGLAAATARPADGDPRLVAVSCGSSSSRTTSSSATSPQRSRATSP